MKHQDLIERLEKLTGPDRRLDFDIWFCATPEGKCESEWPEDQLKMSWEQWFENWKSDRSVIPAYTGSIDAALTLVPEGYSYHLNFGSHIGGASCWVCPGGPDSGGVADRRSADGFHATTPIALCIAALKARQAMTSDDDSQLKGHVG